MKLVILAALFQLFLATGTFASEEVSVQDFMKLQSCMQAPRECFKKAEQGSVLRAFTECASDEATSLIRYLNSQDKQTLKVNESVSWEKVLCGCNHTAFQKLVDIVKKPTISGDYRQWVTATPRKDAGRAPTSIPNTPSTPSCFANASTCFGMERDFGVRSAPFWDCMRVDGYTKDSENEYMMLQKCFVKMTSVKCHSNPVKLSILATLFFTIIAVLNF